MCGSARIITLGILTTEKMLSNFLEKNMLSVFFFFGKLGYLYVRNIHSQMRLYQ